jgi:hypothetical protein
MKQEFLFALLVMTILSHSLAYLLFSPQDIFAPSEFSRQEAVDPSYDWFDNARGIPSTNPEALFQATDIRAVNFFSNGKFLNATMWIHSPFQEQPSSQFGRVSYGAYIDADFDNKTGLDGIDYRAEVMYENRTWTRIFEEWSTLGGNRTLDRIDHYTDLSSEGQRFVKMYVDLEAIGSPENYRVVFFAETSNGLANWHTDYTNWIVMPPPEFVVNTIPESVILDQGGNDNIEIRITSATGNEHKVSFLPPTSEAAESLNLTEDSVYIPSFGMASTRLHITAKPNAEPGSHSVFLIGNVEFPLPSAGQSPIGDNIAASADITQDPLQDLRVQVVLPKLDNQEVIEASSFVLTIKKPLTWLEQINNFWDDWGNVISFILGTSVFAFFKERVWKLIKPKILRRKTHMQR